MIPARHQLRAAVVGGSLCLLAWSTPSAAPALGQDAPPVSFDALSEKARQAREGRRVDEAMSLYGRALALRPTWHEGRWDLAVLCYGRGEYANARDEAARLVAAQPGSSAALALRGLARARLGEESQALTDLLQARSLGVDQAEIAHAAALEAAILLNRSENPDAALEVLRKFAEDGYDSPAVITAFGLSILRLKLRPEEIPEDKREMILLAGRGAYEMSRSRRTTVGQMALEELVARYPREPNVHFAFGRYLLPEDPEAALAEFRRELGVVPDNYAAMVHIVFAELQAGRAEQVLPLAEKAASIAPHAPAARAAFARTLLTLGEIDRAIEELEGAVALIPENPRLRYSLAQAYRQAGRTEDMERERRLFLKLKEDATPETDLDGADLDGSARTSTEAP